MTHTRSALWGLGFVVMALPLAVSAAPEPKAAQAAKGGPSTKDGSAVTAPATGAKPAEAQPKARVGSAEFERVKALKGTWKGTGKMHGKDEPVTIEYSVTSGGTAVVEKMAPGTPHEMVSIYHDENGKLVMTHYCALGNQPKLALQQSSPEKIELSLAKGNALDPNAMHMHALTLLFPAKDKITQEWTSFDKGKKRETSTFALSRVN